MKYFEVTKDPWAHPAGAALEDVNGVPWIPAL
jgi:hypothetical protein